MPGQGKPQHMWNGHRHQITLLWPAEAAPRLRTHVLPRTISIKSRRSAFAIKKNWGKKKAPQKYANWQIDIRFGLETAEMEKNARSWLGRWRWVKLLIIMCPVIANNGGSGSLVCLLASPWSTSSVIFNWLVLSPQKENPLMNIHVYTIYRRYSYGRRALLRSNCVADSAVNLLCCVCFSVCVELCAKCWRFWFRSEINSWSCVMVTRRELRWVKWRHKKAGFADLYT